MSEADLPPCWNGKPEAVRLPEGRDCYRQSMPGHATSLMKVKVADPAACPQNRKESPLAASSHFSDMDEELTDQDELTATLRVPVSTFRELSRAAMESPQPRRELRIQWIALGWADPAQESMRRVARDYGVSPEAISKAVAHYQTTYRLPRNLHNKAPEARAKYATCNRPRTS